MEEAYKITRENSQKAALKTKSHYDRKVRSSVLQPGDWVLIRNLTPRGGPGKLRNHWEDAIHIVGFQISKEIPVYELRPEEGRKRSRNLHRNLLLPCDHLPIEMPGHTRTERGSKTKNEEPEKPEEEDDDDVPSAAAILRLPT